MKKVYNFLNNPWVAFSLMVGSLVLFMWLGLKYAGGAV